MKRWLPITSQILAMAGQMYIPSLPLSDTHKHVAQSTVGFLQGVLAILMLYMNPPNNGGSKRGRRLTGAAAVLVLGFLCGAVARYVYRELLASPIPARPASAPSPKWRSRASLHVASGSAIANFADADRPERFFDLMEATR